LLAWHSRCSRHVVWQISLFLLSNTSTVSISNSEFTDNNLTPIASLDSSVSITNNRFHENTRSGFASILSASIHPWMGGSSIVFSGRSPSQCAFSDRRRTNELAFLLDQSSIQSYPIHRQHCAEQQWCTEWLQRRPVASLPRQSLPLKEQRLHAGRRVGQHLLEQSWQYRIVAAASFTTAAPPQQHSLIDSISTSWLCVCLWLRVASSVVSLAEAAVQFTNNVLTNEQGVSCDSGGLTQCQIDMNGNQWLTTSAVNYFALKGSFLGSVSGVYLGAWTGWPGAMLWR